MNYNRKRRNEFFAFFMSDIFQRLQLYSPLDKIVQSNRTRMTGIRQISTDFLIKMDILLRKKTTFLRGEKYKLLTDWQCFFTK